jgi:hypothetical protein
VADAFPGAQDIGDLREVVRYLSYRAGCDLRPRTPQPDEKHSRSAALARGALERAHMREPFLISARNFLVEQNFYIRSNETREKPERPHRAFS